MRSSRISALLALSLCGAAFAGELSIQRFRLPELGTLVMPVPDAWNSHVRSSADGLPTTLAFTGKSGPAFEVFIAPFADPDRLGLRRQVDRMAKAAKPHAAEKVLSVRTLKGTSGAGYYFSATVRQPAAGEYTFLTQGIVPVGGMVITFTILSNDGAESTVSTALLLLQDVSLAKNTAG